MPEKIAPDAPLFGGDSEQESSAPIYRLPARFGKYLLIKRLGVGGMAEAFLAQQDGPHGFQKNVVVKRMLPHLADGQNYVDMFQREARVAAMLTHSNVVQIFELGQQDGTHFIAMEYVDGAALHSLSDAAHRRHQPLPLELVCCAVADAALGLAAAHALVDPSTGEHMGVVHRDISPDNLMINREGVTKILDFGVAKIRGADTTNTGNVKGKIPYLAPEHILGKTLDARADIFSLGVTFYALATGRRPFVAQSNMALMEAIVAETPAAPLSLAPELPPFINDLIVAMLEKDPAHRPQSADEIHDHLRDALAQRRTVVVPYLAEALTGTLVTNAEQITDTLARAPAALRTAALAERWQKRFAYVSIDDSEEEAVPRRARVPRAATLALLTMVAVGSIALAVSAARRGGHSSVAAPVIPAPLIPPPPTPTPPPTPIPPPGPTLPTPPPDPVPVPDPPPVATPNARTFDLKAAAPARVRWQTEGGRVLGMGSGTLKVPVGVSRLIAFDTKRGVKSTVPITGSLIDYGVLPRGKIQTRANPFADVFLGTEPLGQTPFAPVDAVVGSYVLRFVHEGHEEKRTVQVKPAEVTRVVVDFGG